MTPIALCTDITIAKKKNSKVLNYNLLPVHIPNNVASHLQI